MTTTTGWGGRSVSGRPTGPIWRICGSSSIDVPRRCVGRRRSISTRIPSVRLQVSGLGRRARHPRRLRRAGPTSAGRYFPGTTVTLRPAPVDRVATLARGRRARLVAVPRPDTDGRRAGDRGLLAEADSGLVLSGGRRRVRPLPLFPDVHVLVHQEDPSSGRDEASRLQLGRGAARGSWATGGTPLVAVLQDRTDHTKAAAISERGSRRPRSWSESFLS